MATASSIITRALKMAGIIDAIEAASAEELSDGLESLNELLAGMSIARGLISAQVTEALTLTNGDGIYSIGSGADLSTTRPLRIESAYITSNGVDSPLGIGSRNDYNEIPDKTTQGTPSDIYYDQAFANGDLRFYPVPDAAYVVTVSSWKPISQVSAVGDDVSMPDYLLAYIKVSLAINLATEYRQPVSEVWYSQKSDLEAKMRSLHRQPARARFDMTTAQPYNIEIG